MFARVCGFSISNLDSTEGTAVGELPKAGEAAHQTGGQPGPEEAAGDCKAPT